MAKHVCIWRSVALLAFVACSARALDGFEFTLTAASGSVRTGAPFGMELSVHVNPKMAPPVRAIFVNNDHIHFRIKDAAGKIVSESKPWNWRCNRVPRYEWMAEVSEATGWSAKRYLVLNEWCSTDLPPGKYRAECEISEVGPVRVGEVSSVRTFPKPPIALTFTFEVLSKNDDEVGKEYQRLLQAASAPPTTVEQQVELARNVELIVYAHEPQALQAQLALLSGAVPLYKTVLNECNAIDLADYLAKQNGVVVAQGLMTALDNLNSAKYEMLPDTRDRLTDLVVWAIYELHEHGGADIIALTTPVVQACPKPRDPHDEIY